MALIKSVRGFTPQIGENCYLAENTTIIGDVTIGNDCSIWFNTVLRGDVNSIRIGNRVNIQDGSVLHTLYQKSIVELGDDVSVGHNVTLHGVLANTVIEPYTLWGGVPARFIKKINPEQSKSLNQYTAHNYLTYASWFKKEEKEEQEKER